MAYADAIHDFSKWIRISNFKQILDDSLPGVITDPPLTDMETNILRNAVAVYPMSRLRGSANELFRQLGGTSSTPIAIVCDSTGPSTLIQELNRVTDGQVFFIKNREVFNDPGKSLTHVLRTTPNFRVLYDAFPGKMVYPRYTERSSKHILHSTFDVELYLQNKNTTCVMKHEGVVIEVENTNTTNSVNKIVGRIEDVYDFTRNAVKHPEHLHTRIIQSCFLRKRAGDWLQILSTFDKRRPYIDANGTPTSIENAIVYFCSHDRLAVAVALHYNANCIYYQSSHSEMRMFEPTARMLPPYIELSHFTDPVRIADAKQTIQNGFDTMKMIDEMFIPILTGVTEPTLHSAIDAALQYRAALNDFLTLHTYSTMAKAYLENHTQALFESTDAKQIITQCVQSVKELSTKYMGYDIESRRIPDARLREMELTFEGPDSQKDLFYGGSLFALLLNTNFPIFREFVYRAIDILSGCDNILVKSYYSVFSSMYGFDGPQSGGGILQSRFQQLGELLLLQLTRHPYNTQSIYISATHYIELDDDGLCRRMLEFLLTQGIVIPAYISYKNHIPSLSAMPVNKTRRYRAAIAAPTTARRRHTRRRRTARRTRRMRKISLSN